VHFPEEGRGPEGDQAHRLEPAGAGGLHMEAVLRQSADVGEDGELVAPRMNRDLVAVMLGDDHMLSKLFAEDPQVAQVIDPLLEFSDEAGGE